MRIAEDDLLDRPRDVDLFALIEVDGDGVVRQHVRLRRYESCHQNRGGHAGLEHRVLREASLANVASTQHVVLTVEPPARTCNPGWVDWAAPDRRPCYCRCRYTA